MTNSAFTATPYQSNDAGFRAWGSAVSAGLAAVGMVQTADTGQINWTTVVRPGASTDAGYEIWKFNDTLQATVPIFLKMSYGSGSSPVYPRVTAIVGSVTDGAGTLSGVGLTAPYQISYTNAGDLNARDCWVSSDGSGLALTIFSNSTNTQARGFLIIDRFRDATGTPVSDGWWAGYVAVMGPKAVTVVDVVNSKSFVWSFMPCLIPFPVGPTTSFADTLGNVTAFPWYVGFKQGVFSSKMILSYAVTDLGYDVQQIVNHMGANRTYRSLGGNVPGTDNQINANVAAMIWWSD